MQWRLALEDGHPLATQHVAAIQSFIPRIFFEQCHFEISEGRPICSQLLQYHFYFSLARGAVCPQVARALKLHTHSRFARLVAPAPPRLIYMRAGIQPIFIFKWDIFSNCCPRSQSSL
jgi:hypothetical protein